MAAPFSSFAFFVEFVFGCYMCDRETCNITHLDTVHFSFVVPINGRHEELISEGGAYANMWLQQQKAEEKETHNSNTDSVEEESEPL